MKVKLLLALFLFICQFSFSQTEKLLKGVVSSDNFLLSNVDVINKTSKQYTITNENGEFVIAVKVNDSLFFYNKDFSLKGLKVTPVQVIQNNLQVIMSQKAEELEEVLVAKRNKIKLNLNTWREQSKRDEITAEKNPYTENKVVMVRGNTFVNGLNFWGIGKKVVELLSKKKESEKETPPETEFAVLAKNTCDQKFYLETLKLKSEEIDLFLQFCDVDPKAKALIKNHNVLSMMDFLSAKNIEFQKMKK
ncbi:hypothetical protein CLU83_3987 [Flavobacterium sp. 1]|uniref:hypothetical protein n=1 Tax=Flavobacterium sp. 1 TaxID=2035200 RepID=UPI000C23592B|nr:hypothetical protein [Flavobacterium sp. 1]PJJ10545.1 hypothetical protein CLU83_3987 [Flavobacterium sp. 1]